MLHIMGCVRVNGTRFTNSKRQQNNGTKDHEMTVKVGDQVLYGKYSGTEIELDGEKLMIMKESDIYAII